ncbi:hypothetical protein REPUB_Repub18cG0086900 [Reevesia pubescens]
MNSIPPSQTFKTSPSLPKHIIPLDFNNVPKLPDSHSWTLPNSDDHQPIDPFTQEPSPIIDLAKPNVFNLIRHACEKWGAFQVINHGIPISFLQETEYQTRRLFSLPTERKLLAVRSAEGVTGYGLARISPFFDKLMWSEGFSIIGSPMVHASQLWPEDHAKFCEVMDQYQEKMKTLSEKIVALMIGSLGLTQEEDVKWALLVGLQLYKDNAGWVPVEPIEGALVLNVGDLMSIITNGKFKSVLHRAVVNNTHNRVSVAYFYGPPRDAKISPLKKLIDHDHPPLYRPVTWEEYLETKSKHFNRSLESIRL